MATTLLAQVPDSGAMTAKIFAAADYDTLVESVALTRGGTNLAWGTGSTTATGLCLIRVVNGSNVTHANWSAVIPASGTIILGDMAGVDWQQVSNATSTVGLTGTTISTSQQVASVSGAVGSVTGAVGSVTGNVGGNVTGSVGSVVGAVGSVTGNVGGNVVGNVSGSVGSVVARVTANADQIAGSATAATVMGTVYAAVENGTSQAGGASTITLRAGAPSVSLVNQAVWIVSGTGAVQTNRISAYDTGTKVATVVTPWSTVPDNTSVYLVLGRTE